MAIDVTVEEKERFKTHISHKYIDAITTNLEDRFPNTDTSSFLVFDPQKTPDDKAEDFSSYGDDDIYILACHFNQTIDDGLGSRKCLLTSEVMQSLVQEEIALLHSETLDW